MEFTKLHGLGNDYIYINAITQDLAKYDLPLLSQALSDRHFGIGGDGIILVLPAKQGDFRMRIFNSDGSEAEMCGNGVRAFAKYVYEHGLSRRKELEIETDAGLIKPVLTVKGGKVISVRVNMGRPRLERAQIPMLGEPQDRPVLEEPLQVNGQRFSVTCVSMGNPHCVIYVDDVESFPLSEVGPRIEHHPSFPRRTNVEFVTVLDREHLQMRVWERGAGETLACGTGACAVCVASVLTGRSDRSVSVTLLGGDLHIEWADTDEVFLTGTATEAFSGTIAPELLEAARG